MNEHLKAERKKLIGKATLFLLRHMQEWNRCASVFSKPVYMSSLPSLPHPTPHTISGPTQAPFCRWLPSPLPWNLGFSFKAVSPVSGGWLNSTPVQTEDGVFSFGPRPGPGKLPLGRHWLQPESLQPGSPQHLPDKSRVVSKCTQCRTSCQPSQPAVAGVPGR